MWTTSLIPFVLQALLIVLDEGVFHVKRGLPLWEKRGHPLDTLTVLLCLGFVLFVPFSKSNLFVYSTLALFSTVFVTKDEFVHSEYCKPTEQWLHALLFTLHPITLLIAGFIWPVAHGFEVAPWISDWLNNPEGLFLFLLGQFILMTLFFLYQIIFWNILWKNKPVLKP